MTNTTKEFKKLNLDPIAASIETITPDIAKRYLAEQQNNRRISEGRVKDYADRMLRGEWEVSQPIIFDTEEKLIDGQHRLLAVIRYGNPVKFAVLKGLKTESRETFDQGQARSASQIASIMGYQPSSLPTRFAILKAAFIGQYLQPKNKSAEANAKKIARVDSSISPKLLIELSERYSEGLDFALSGVNSDMATPNLSVVKAVIFRAFYNENHARLRDFVNVYYTGVNNDPEKDIAAISLREYLIKEKARSGGLQLTRNTRLSIYKKAESALKHFIAGNSIKGLKGSDIEEFPLPDFD